MTELSDTILLAHGGGGRLMADLISKTIGPRVYSSAPALTDAAEVNVDDSLILFTTDSFVVQPLFFPGGDIGKLAVCGTVNDLAVSGAEPIALSLALIIEEGFPTADLERILDSIGKTAHRAHVTIATGDTKVVEKGAADGIFINTAGIGQKKLAASVGFHRIEPGDVVLINGTLGDHGMTIMSRRQELALQSPLQSDCACLNEIITMLLEELSDQVKFMRDPTRGGLAAVTNEIVQACGCGIELREDALPVDPTVKAAADILGFDILNIANEGKFVAVVSPQAQDAAMEILRKHPLGQKAACIGHIGPKQPHGLVELITRIGGRRIVQMPYGRELPRIC
ncbi:MAG: hydrogenase expression/formation protein HypE [Anaerohalosphaeraceae bacterium]